MTKQRERGYLLPDVIDPGAEQCIRVYVPDDPLYIAAFWYSYEFLCTWLAWERDSAHRGAQAAAVWRPSFERARSEYLASIGACGIMDVRQNPGQPCKLDKLDEGEWSQFADLRLCVPKMRILNGVLQQDTTGAGDWQDAGNPLAPYEPRFDDFAPPPWSDPPPGESGQCLSAVNVAEYVNYVSADAADWMVDGLLFFQTLGMAVSILTALMGLISLTILTAFITALYTQVVDDWQDVRDFEITSKLTELMLCLYNIDGSMTKTQWQALVDDMNAWRDTLVDIDQRAKWWIAIQFVSLWGNVGMTLLGQVWGIDSYECDYGTCEWEHVWDAVNGWDGWQTVEGAGHLVAGVWVNDCIDNYDVLIVNSPALDSDITILEIEFHYTTTWHPFGRNRWQKQAGDEAMSEWFEFPYDTGSHDETHIETVNIRRVQFDIESTPCVYPCTLSYVRIKGIGPTDPYL